MGVHIWAGELVLQMKEQPGYEDIGLVVVLPAPGHDAKWDVRRATDHRDPAQSGELCQAKPLLGRSCRLPDSSQ